MHNGWWLWRYAYSTDRIKSGQTDLFTCSKKSLKDSVCRCDKVSFILVQMMPLLLLLHQKIENKGAGSLLTFHWGSPNKNKDDTENHGTGDQCEFSCIYLGDEVADVSILQHQGNRDFSEELGCSRMRKYLSSRCRLQKMSSVTTNHSTATLIG